RKQNMQLASKMRFISAQFEALLTNRLWLKNASHANEMALLLERELEEIPGIQITQPVEANAIFAQIPGHAIPRIQKKCFFYVWDEDRSIVRWMTSFDTTPGDIREFIQVIRTAVGQPAAGGRSMRKPSLR